MADSSLTTPSSTLTAALSFALIIPTGTLDESRFTPDISETWSEDEGEKRIITGIIGTLMEEEGEEEGLLDGIIGMVNNPLIKGGFVIHSYVFGTEDISEYEHSLKKLCAFLG